MEITFASNDYLVVDRFFTRGQCRHILKEIERVKADAHDGAMQYGNGTVIDRSRRSVRIPPYVPSRFVSGLLYRYVLWYAELYFNEQVDSLDEFNTLLYYPGDKYEDHYDAARDVDGVFTVTNKRKISAVVYLSDYGTDFTGGEFVFPKLNVTIDPKPGRLLLFRSETPQSLHRANPVKTGERIALVNWFERRV